MWRDWKDSACSWLSGIRAFPPLEREVLQVMPTTGPGTHGCLFGLQGGTEQPRGLGAESAAVLEKPWEKAESPGRGSRHAQKGCPSEGHCREHSWRRHTCLSSTRAPPKATLTLQDTRQTGSGRAIRHAAISKPITPLMRDTRRYGHLPMLLWDTGSMESPATGVLCWTSPKVTEMPPATGTSHLQSHYLHHPFLFLH